MSRRRIVRRRQREYSRLELLDIHLSRSPRSQILDESFKAKIVKPEEYYKWASSPNRYDIVGIDYPKKKKEAPKNELQNYIERGRKLPSYYWQNGFYFKIDTKKIDELEKDLQNLKAPKYFRIQYDIKRKPRVSEVNFLIFRPAIAVSLRSSMSEFNEVKASIDDITKAIGDDILKVMEKHDARILLYRDYAFDQLRDKYVSIDEWKKEMAKRTRLKPALASIRRLGEYADHPIKHRDSVKWLNWKSIYEALDELPEDEREFLKYQLEKLSKQQFKNVMENEYGSKVIRKLLGHRHLSKKKLTKDVVESTLRKLHEKHGFHVSYHYGLKEELEKQNYDTQNLAEILKKLEKEGKVKLFPTNEVLSMSWYNEELKKKRKAEASYNKATGWISVKFEEKPDKETLSKLKDAGFRYEPKSKVWRASWTYEREKLVKDIAGEIETIEKGTNYAKLVQKHLKLAEKYEKEAKYHYDRYEGIKSAIPMGQPILVGHYSEKSHRRDLERMDKHLKKYLELKEKAEYHKERAEYYAKLAFEGEKPETVYNRIKRLESEKRRLERELAYIEIEKKKGKGCLRKYGVYTDDEDRIKTMLQRTTERLESEKKKFKVLTGKTFEEVDKERKEEAKRRAVEKRKRKVELPFELKKGDIVDSPFGKAKVVKINPKTVVVEKEGYQFKLRKELIGKVS